MIDSDTLTALRSVSGKGAESPHFETACAWLRSTLSTLPLHGTWTTRQLYEFLGIADEPHTYVKRITMALWQMRKSGKIADCWRQDKGRRHMGNPVILWTHPRPDISAVFKAEDF